MTLDFNQTRFAACLDPNQHLLKDLYFCYHYGAGFYRLVCASLCWGSQRNNISGGTNKGSTCNCHSIGVVDRVACLQNLRPTFHLRACKSRRVEIHFSPVSEHYHFLCLSSYRICPRQHLCVCQYLLDLKFSLLLVTSLRKLEGGPCEKSRK